MRSARNIFGGAFRCRGRVSHGGGVLFWFMHAAAASIFVNAFAATCLTVPTLFAGLAWGWMRQRFGSPWPAFLTHLAADVAILRVATMLVRT